jgi:muconate cycloisomerase
MKLKVDDSTGEDDIRLVRQIAGSEMDLRVDANMAWTVEGALERMALYARYGIHSFEQPLAADDLDGAARLVRETGLDVMADESLHTNESLRRLIEANGCTAINARISKCGGLIATQARCREAIDAGLWVQVGCQVGESSLLSAAQLQLCGAILGLRYAEGCFGLLLLKEDPVFPQLRMGWGGRPPEVRNGFGLGVEIDRVCLARYRVGSWSGGESHVRFGEFEERT